MMIYFILALSVLITLNSPANGVPVLDESEPQHGTINDLNTNNQHLFVLTPLEDETNVPENAFVVKPHDHNIQPHLTDAGSRTAKAIAAIPLADVKHDTTVLHHNGQAVIARHTDNSDEDLVTAENIVFRPLFAYRSKLSQRRRVYAQTPTANRRYYTAAPQTRPTYPYSYPSYGHPYYYPSDYNRRTGAEVDRFPVLA